MIDCTYMKAEDFGCCGRALQWKWSRESAKRASYIRRRTAFFFCALKLVLPLLT
jgi:hypothetical protein